MRIRKKKKMIKASNRLKKWINVKVELSNMIGALSLKSSKKVDLSRNVTIMRQSDVLIQL
jgi:hypothetical protein